MSSKVKTTVSFSLAEFSQHGGKSDIHVDGWGLASYEGKTASIYREAEPAAFSQKLKFIQAHPFKTRCVISHIRRATVGAVALRNTQPFVRHINGRSHVFAHNGDLAAIENKSIMKACVLEGETDSERAFCYLISALLPLWETGTPSLQDRTAVVGRIFTELAELGIANFLYSDGDYVYAFADKRKQLNGKIEPPGMYFLERQCRCDSDALKRAGVDINCDPQQVFLFASVPLTDEQWQPLAQHKLMVVENGDLRSDSA